MRKKDEKKRAEQVDRYIDQDATDANAPDAKTRQVIETLQQAAAETRPRPGFINELANQLREQETIMSEKPTRTFWSIASRLLLGGVTVVAVAVFALYLAGVFGTPSTEPAAADDEAEPRPVLEAAGGEHFPGAEFRVMAALSEEGGEIPLYTAQRQIVPDTVDEALALGKRFGLENPTVYQAGSETNRWIVTEDGGRNISFRTDNATLEGIYYSVGQWRPAVAEAEPLAEAEAKQAAAAFLEEVGMLPDGYEAEVNLASEPVRNVRIIPLVDGHPLAGNQNQIEIGVGPQGDIIFARINLPRVEPAGERVPIKSAKQAFSELVEGNAPSISYSFETVPGTTGEETQIFSPPPPEHTPGEEVTETGWLQVLVPVADGSPQAILQSYTGGIYYLRGPAVADIATSAPQGTVEVKGAIGEASGPGAWTLTISEVGAGPALSIECKIGMITGNGERVTLESEEGEHYSLAYAPEGLALGARAEVCAGNFDGEEPVEWVQIASPPIREGAVAGGGGGGSTVSVAVETAEDAQVERAVGVDEAAVNEVVAAPSSSGSGGGGGGGGVAADVAEQPSPYEIGEVVEITGTVQGVTYLEGETRRPEIALRHEESVNGERHFFVYPLVGEPQLLEAIAEANQLHVRVSGQVIPRPEGRGGTHDQGLVVESFERLYPEEKIEAFLGHLEQETLDGEAVTVLVDEESGRRYLLNYPLNQGQQPEDRRVWVAGVVQPERSVNGLPLLHIYESRTGSDIDEAEDPGEIDFDPGMPVIDRAQMGQSDLQGTLIVEEAALGYRYEPRPGQPVPAGDEPAGAEEPIMLDPVWLFSGHTEDGTTTFVIQVPATVDNGGGRE